MRMIPKLLVAALPVLAACSPGGESADDRPAIAVTTTVLASIVGELVGDAATVTAIIPDGTDPHDFAPSAKDVERMNNAALVVTNGLDLEEGLTDVLDNVSATQLFVAAEHVTMRSLTTSGEHRDEAADAHGDEHADDEHGGKDPHLWLSPFTVSEFVPALAAALGEVIDRDLTAAGESLVADLLALDASVAAQVDALESCELITGHEELGYFADRYGCEVIGTVIPSSTTTAEASAAQIAALEEAVTEHGAKSIFVGVGTPTKVAEQIARDTGVPTVVLNTHVMGDVENYDRFIRNLTDTIVDALS